MQSLDHFRAHLAHKAVRLRNRLGRAGTIAGAAALVASLITPYALWAVPVVIGTAGIGALALRSGRSKYAGALLTMYLAAPAILLGDLIALHLTHLNWATGIIAVVWSAATWWMRPCRTVRIMLDGPDPAPAGGPGTPQAWLPATPEERLVDWWSQAAAQPGGIAPDTHLEHAQVTGPHDFRAHIVASVPGRPVPTIAINMLSALTNIPPERITVGPVPGHGTGRMQLSVSTGAHTAEADADPFAAWEEQIAPKVMKGAVLTHIVRGNTKTGLVEEQGRRQ